MPLNSELELSCGQLEVLKVIADIKGDTLQTYIKDAVLNEHWGEIDLNFKVSDKRRDEYYQKLGCKLVTSEIW